MIVCKTRNAPGWATKEDNLIPNGVKCNENVIWVSVLRLLKNKNNHKMTESKLHKKNKTILKLHTHCVYSQQKSLKVGESSFLSIKVVETTSSTQKMYCIYMNDCFMWKATC